MKLKSLIKLVRFQNLIMVLFTLLLTKYALINSFDSYVIYEHQQFLMLCLSILFITAGGYIVNDIFDVKTDNINKPYRVIVGKSISVSEAWVAYGILSILGLALGTYVSFNSGHPLYSLIFITITIGLYLYADFLKTWPLIGNILIAAFVSFTIYTVVLFEANNMLPSNILAAFAKFFTSISLGYAIFTYLIFSFLSTLVREMIKDIEDIKGDYTQKMKTLPIVLGVKRSNRIAVFFTVVLLLFLVMVCKAELMKHPFFLGYVILFIIAPLVYFLYRLWIAKETIDYRYLSSLLKIIMCFGILSMLFLRF